MAVNASLEGQLRRPEGTQMPSQPSVGLKILLDFA